MIFVFKPIWIITIMSILIALIARKNGKNGFIYGIIAYISAMAIAALIVFVDPIFNFWYQILGLSEWSMYIFISSFVGTFLYKYINTNTGYVENESHLEDDVEEEEEEEEE